MAYAWSKWASIHLNIPAILITRFHYRQVAGLTLLISGEPLLDRPLVSPDGAVVSPPNGYRKTGSLYAAADQSDPAFLFVLGAPSFPDERFLNEDVKGASRFIPWFARGDSDRTRREPTTIMATSHLAMSLATFRISPTR